MRGRSTTFSFELRGRTVVVPEVEYTWHCLTCHTANKYGAAMIRRDVAAAKHHGRFPHHNVLLQRVMTDRVFYANSDPKLGQDGDVPY